MVAIFLWPHARGLGSFYNRTVSSLSKQTFQAKTSPLKDKCQMSPLKLNVNKNMMPVVKKKFLLCQHFIQDISSVNAALICKLAKLNHNHTSMSHHNDTLFKPKWKRLFAIWLLNRVFRIIWRVLIAEVCQIWHIFTGVHRHDAGTKWLPCWFCLSIQCPRKSTLHIHNFQHHRLCLCLHHCITNVLVSCLCNFRQPTGSFHLLNWSRLPVLKLVSRFLESRLFSPHLVLCPCASAKILGHSVIKRQRGATNIGYYPRQMWLQDNSRMTIQSDLLKNQIVVQVHKPSLD